MSSSDAQRIENTADAAADDPERPHQPLSNVSLVVAMSEDRVIGRDGGLPWHLSDDLKHFKRLTWGHVLVMGRKTFESLDRLLPGRHTIVITRRPDQFPQASNDFEQPAPQLHVATSLSEALNLAGEHRQVFVVGGGEIYSAAVPYVSKIFLTRVHTTVPDGDTWFPQIDWSGWTTTSRQEFKAGGGNETAFTIETLTRST